MPSVRSKLVRFMLKHMHLLRGRIKREVIDFDTSIEKLRENVTKSAARMGKLPKGIKIMAASFGDFYAEWVEPEGCSPEQAILYFHGSGFVMGTSKDHRTLVGKLVARCGVKALVFDYSLAPEHPFPAAVNDSVSIYRWMLNQGFKPENIVFVGDSAGACIALSTLLVLKDGNEPMPAAIVAISPCTDLTCSGQSHITKMKRDPVTPKGATKTYTTYYIGKGDPHNPYMSPLFGDLRGLPPVMIQVGEDETLLDDSLRFAQRAKEAGVVTELHVW
ncbi:MAG TPA: alpha/beta hydrolase, partial [Clostridia bacterium]|nr:alpha/beta hydrolase [Clostridia bacterium]